MQQGGINKTEVKRKNKMKERKVWVQTVGGENRLKKERTRGFKRKDEQKAVALQSKVCESFLAARV